MSQDYKIRITATAGSSEMPAIMNGCGTECACIVLCEATSLRVAMQIATRIFDGKPNRKTKQEPDGNRMAT